MTLRSLLLSAAFLLFLFSCSHNRNKVKQITTAIDLPIAEAPSDLKGVYHPGQFKSENSELYTFIPYVQHMLDSMYNKLLPNPYPNQTVYLYFRGVPDSLPTNTGYRTNVIEIRSMELKNANNCPIPYDYWCSGNEPFWQLQISEKENLIDFYNPMDQSTQHFIYVKPIVRENSVVYPTTRDNSSDKIKIVLTKEKCKDGMSDKEYDFKVEFTLNGKLYKGCAVKYNK